MSGASQLPSSKPQLWLIKAESAGRTEAYQEEAEAVGFAVRYLPPLAERYETAELEELQSEFLRRYPDRPDQFRIGQARMQQATGIRAD